MAVPYVVSRPLSVTEGGEPLSKNELKKRAKQLEKEKKAVEKAVKQAELAKQREATDVVCPISIDHTIYVYGPARTTLSSSTANCL